MDDYAHHPTEVLATLAAARSRFPGRRLVVLFQPHTYTRTRYLLDGFRDCFHECDVLMIARTYAAREEPDRRHDCRRARARDHRPAGATTPANSTSLHTPSPRCWSRATSFFTVGAGDVEKVGPMVLELLRSR